MESVSDTRVDSGNPGDSGEPVFVRVPVPGAAKTARGRVRGTWERVEPDQTVSGVPGVPEHRDVDSDANETTGERKRQKPPKVLPWTALVERARESALYYLDSGPRTVHEVAQKLRDRGYPDDIITVVIDRLVTVGLLDDVAFADAWVRSRSERKRLGRAALRFELRRKGIPDDVVAGALEQVDDEGEQERAYAAAAAYASRVTRLPVQKQIARIASMLQRKGYAGSLAFAAARAAVSTDVDIDFDE